MSFTSPITSMGLFPRIVTLRFLPVMTMNDHPYASLHILHLANSLQSKIETQHLSSKTPP
ncbi:hypothetical protein BGY98DRAFT_1024933, partial [Russula aff. rugulosa BPL654]